MRGTETAVRGTERDTERDAPFGASKSPMVNIGSSMLVTDWSTAACGVAGDGGGTHIRTAALQRTRALFFTNERGLGVFRQYFRAGAALRF